MFLLLYALCIFIGCPIIENMYLLCVFLGGIHAIDFCKN
ncbi:putative membrane protein [Ehrlichia chaffeensis str. Liberty]|nr:putative membrane protein [Ehrlichia chaffeensis str. Jax]AHX06359.1 putative membrane protein [Ehrlichia chaffeensis str. Liberty]AHX09375.1 putative membrane protein [Ehrlichia chaffeensis str. Wakulla]